MSNRSLARAGGTDVLALKRRDADIALLLDLTDDFLHLSDEAELMRVVGGKLAAHLELDSYNFFEVDEAHGTTTNSASWQAPGVADLRGTYRLADYLTDALLQALRAGETCVMNDTQEEPPTNNGAPSHPQVRASIIVPYNRDGAWEACLVVNAGRARQWRLEEVELVRQVANRTFPQIQRIRAEQGFARTNSRLNEILANSPDDFYVLDRGWVLRFVSRTFAARTGRVPEDFLGQNFWETFPKHVGGELDENFHIAMESGETRRFEMSGRYTDASYSMTAFPAPEGIAVIATDITHLKRAETALRESEARYRQIVETANEGIWEIGKDTRTTFVNSRMAGMLGYPAAEILGRTPFEFMFPEDIPAADRRLEQAKGGRPAKASEFRWRRKDGSALWTLNTTSPRFDEQANFLGSSAMLMDVTERRRVEEALSEREQQLQILNATLEERVEEKTAEVRELAADITRAVQRERKRLSHVLHDDLQQRIYAIQIQMSLHREMLLEEEEHTWAETSEIERQLAQVLEITRNLSIDLNPPILREEGLTHAITWLADRTVLRYGLPVKVHAGEPFDIPDAELHVFLVNCVRELLRNTVRHAQARHAAVRLNRVDGHLHIEVRDDGRGFPLAEAEAHKGGDDESVTLGIPAMRRQLTVFGGTMDIRSAPGRGTKILLIVPLPH